jgi:hypothetical protein
MIPDFQRHRIQLGIGRSQRWAAETKTTKNTHKRNEQCKQIKNGTLEFAHSIK